MKRLILAFAMLASLIFPMRAQSQATLDETLQWIKGKFESTVDGVPKREWYPDTVYDGSFRLNERSFTWTDTTVAIRWSGTLTTWDKYYEEVKVPIFEEYKFRLEDVLFAGNKDDVNNDSYGESYFGYRKANGIDFASAGGLKKIEHSYIALKQFYHGKKAGRQFYYFEDNRGTVTELGAAAEIYFGPASIRDRARKAFEYAIDLAKKKYPPKQEIF